MLVLKHGDHDEANLSNWWVPNELAVYELLRLCGFENARPVWERKRPSGSRLCVHADATGRIPYERILPRKPEAMSLFGGDRAFE